MGNIHTITRNIALLYDLAQLVPVQRLSSRHYRFTLPGKGVWDYNPGRNTVKLVGTGLDIKAEPDVVEWVKEKWYHVMVTNGKIIDEANFNGTVVAGNHPEYTVGDHSVGWVKNGFHRV